jgi:very-short-patch-repair endonuclease
MPWLEVGAVDQRLRFVAKGFRVLRFSNLEIHNSPELVAERVLAAIEELGPVPRL